MDLCYKKFDWKPLPDNLSNKILKFAQECHEKNIGRVWQRELSVYLLHPKLRSDIITWYARFNDKHRPPIHKSPGVQITVLTTDINPHSDPYRDTTFFYLLKNGGPNVKTSWWDNPDNLGRAEVFPVDGLNMIESHVVEQGTWNMFNHEIVHSVENVKDMRISLSFHLNFASMINGPLLRDIFKQWKTMDFVKEMYE
jgi:hypothetical protein